MRHPAKAFAVVSVLLVLVFAAPASAAYVHTGTFATGSGSGDGELSGPGRAAVEQTTGNLFVVDSGNHRVQVFGPNGSGGADYLTQFGGGELSAPWGIALDENAGQTFVYVADAGNDRIVRYASDEAAVPSFSVDASFTSPAKGTGVGEVGDFHAALANDPSTHDLLVADPADDLIQRFEADGTFVASFDGSNGASAFSGLLDLAVNSTGDIYLIDSNGDIANQAGTSQALRYSGSGEYLATISPVGPNQRPAIVAVNPADDSVVVSGEQDAVYRDESPTLHIFDSANGELPAPSLSAQYDTVSGLAVSGASGRLYVALDEGYYLGTPFGAPQIQAFGQTNPPAVTIDPVAAGTITATAAEFTGTVNPNGQATDWHFEYSSDGGSSWASTPGQDAGSGTTAVPVSASVDLLNPNSPYEVQLVASNPDGSTTAGPVGFHTAQSAPFVRTGIPGQVMDTSAWLRGSVNPAGEPTTYYFEYGFDTSYGGSLPATKDGSAGQGTTARGVGLRLSGLQPNTTYHYRLVAANGSGVELGLDRSFKTATTPPQCANESVRKLQSAWMLADCRGWEMVSPVWKAGAEVSPAGGAQIVGGAQASTSGDGVAYSSPGSFTDPIAGGTPSFYLGERGLDDWANRQLNVHQEPHKGLGYASPVLAASSDLSRTLVRSRDALAPGATEVENVPNLYVRDSDDGSLKLVVSSQATLSTGTLDQYVDSTPDMSHVLVESPAALLPGAVAGGSNLYEWVDGPAPELHLVAAAAAGGVEAALWSNGIPTTAGEGFNAISADGSRVLYVEGSDPGAPIGAIYMREGGGAPVEVSASQRSAPDPNGPQPAVYGAATRAQDYVFFTSAEKLTDNATTGPASEGSDLYRYETATGELTDLTVDQGGTNPNGAKVIGGAGVSGVLAVSADGSYVYFIAEGDLAPGAVAGAPNLYVWHDGTIEYVAPAAITGNGTSRFLAIASPSGRYLAFVSSEPLGGAQTGGRESVYLYDATAAELACASCNPNGTAATADAVLMHGFNFPSFTARARNFVTDGGSVFFDTVAGLLPADGNGRQDVYEFSRGQLNLISSGRSETNSNFYDASLSGEDVYFSTREQLVSRDIDRLMDVYDARVDGGLTAQNQPPLPPACDGEGCRAPTVPSVPASAPASSAISGAGNAKPKRAQRKKCQRPKSKGAHKKRHCRGSEPKAGKQRNHRHG